MFNWFRGRRTKPGNPADAPLGGDPQAARQPFTVAGLRLLIVDDNDHLLDILKALLQRHGATVETAADGTEGLSKWRARADPFDAILLDQAMPGMQGDEVVQRIRSDEDAPSRGVPIILMSGHPDPGYATDECIFHLQKPFAMDSVIPAIGRALGQPPTREWHNEHPI